MKGIAPLRKRKGLTQEQLAKELGIDRCRLAMWEIGKAWPPSELLPKLARILGVSIEELYVIPDCAETQ